MSLEAPRAAPTRLGVAFVSAAAYALYGNHPLICDLEERWHEVLSNAAAWSSRVSPIATLFAGETVERGAPPAFFGGDETQRALNAQAYPAVPSEPAPPCMLSLLRDVTLNDAAIYFEGGEACTMLYEMQRPNDRPVIHADQEIHVRARQRLPADSNSIFLLIASAGFRNWGHWLTDDLPRVKAAAFLREQMPRHKLTIVLISAGEAFDDARRHCMEQHPDLAGVSFAFVDKTPYHFEQIFYATPVSYHPTLKLRSAVEYVRNTFAPSPPAAVRKLFVTRPAGLVRALENAAEVEDLMLAKGFEIVDCSSLSFADQARLFSEAAIVVGLMGAGMANTIFSPHGTPVVHLLSDQWVEPYYWDLADTCGHPCTYVLGSTTKLGDLPHFSNFSVSTKDLQSALESALPSNHR